jgi:energy-coupling factor transport system substrate-specific component
MLVIAAVAGLFAFLWPFFFNPDAVLVGDRSGATTAPLVCGLVLFLVTGLLLVQVTGGDLDVKALAMLGVLTAAGAVIRPLGAGAAGLETVFFLLILAGRAFGPGFGFALGSLALLASAFITAGFGPWLPYQMIAAGFVGLGAGLLPARRPNERGEIVLLGVYGAAVSFVFGFLMDLAFWPFLYGSGNQAGFDPTLPWWENLHTFAVVTAVTSLGWNIGRAVTTVVLIALLGPGLLRIFRRAARRARWSEK